MGYQDNKGGYANVPTTSYSSWPEGAAGGATQGLSLGFIASTAALYAPSYTVYDLLDMMASAVAAAAFSFNERLRTAYAGSAFRVRRASDSTEQDIGFTSTGLVDTAALSTFCSGTDGFIVTVYDQTANGRDLTQSTTANQPQIWTSGGGAITAGTQGRLAARWDGTNDRLTRADSMGLSGDCEWGASFLVREHGTPGSGDRFIFGTGTALTGRAVGAIRAAAARNMWTTQVAQNCVFDTAAPDVASSTYQYNFMRRAVGTELQNTLCDTNGAALTFSSSSHPTALANILAGSTSWGDALNSGLFLGQIESDALILWSTYPRTTDKTFLDAWYAARI